jgi:hypothetical protein
MINNDLSFMSEASCQSPEVNPDWWHPEEVHVNNKKPRSLDEQRARKICSSCPVLKECRDYGLQFFELYGIWGGLDRKERNDTQKKMRMTPVHFLFSFPGAILGRQEKHGEA